ncbi:family 26 glycoside hydrolase [Melampsora americana]|nr:family 26 glycoside hydrolase [Melampsora americana]
MRTFTLRCQILSFMILSLIVNQVITVGHRPSHSRIRRTVQEKKNHRASRQSNHNFNHHKERDSYGSTSNSQSSFNESCSINDFPSDFSISANDSKTHSLNSSDEDSNESSNKMSSSNSTLNSNETLNETFSSEETDENKLKKNLIELQSDSKNSSSIDSSKTNKSESTTSSLSGVFSSEKNIQTFFFFLSRPPPKKTSIGFLPDDGSSGGDRETMAQINSALGTKSSAYGFYSQLSSDKTYDGSQLLAVMDDVKACGCVFQPAVMPTHGWSGLTSDDNSQAVAIAKVMKKFTDEGIPVWLRFAHEVNYYQTDGTYQGTSEDFKKAWATVSEAIKSIAPEVKMWWTPNVASDENYIEYEPYELSTVDLVGIDFYPKKLTGSDFLQTMKSFMINMQLMKFKWLSEITEAKSSMPQFITMSWFNFHKEYNYRIVGESELNSKLTSFLAS